MGPDPEDPDLEDPDPEDIACWQRIDARLTTSGRLKESDVARLAAIGVERAINLALDDSPGALVGEAALMARAGIAYTQIPVPFDAPDEAHFAAFRAAMEAAGDAVVHVHCIMNWRVSAFLYRYHREARGMAEDEARALMERHWSPGTSTHKDAPAWAAFIAAAAPALNRPRS
ncbi:beta-lactamase hydrolase domain-containing protein [Novosphingobium album (ex Liu et al. 2023)]|uniref:Sulfur transferase domain-containing protein n=1 Tax=Novosphingobium album (ex Liu et al. 2023) TaxID=3031130 RepID=A0ABT5WVS3_9SPHN|nr:sulfur transferase domain-containing protein [Novosphingobium album (ex Liu et al. 2023)]MDE8653963.1 sulfur transferase domain-containing protein [Novosphingobium album (ex Liu et al. 2023)]